MKERNVSKPHSLRAPKTVNPQVLIVIGTLEIGGAEKHVVSLTPMLKDEGVSCSVCTLLGGGPLVSSLREQDVKVFCAEKVRPFKYGFMNKIPRLRGVLQHIKSVLLLLQVIYKLRPAVIHFFLPQAYIVGGFVSLIFPNIKRVMSRRSLNLYSEKKPIARRLEKFLHGRMDLVIGNSKAVISDLIQEGVSTKKLVLQYNGVRNYNYERSSKNKDETIELLVLANLIFYKGHRILFEALAELPIHFSWRLTCVGRDDNYQSELETIARNLMILDRVDFTGSVGDPAPYLERADIGVNCSDQEGFSNAVLEYMSSGLGIVATDVGGNAEAVRHGVDGIIVPKGSPDAMRKAILELFSGSVRAKYGASAKKRASETFSLEACVESYQDIYRRVLD